MAFFCPKCKMLLTFISRKWVCETCGNSSKHSKTVTKNNDESVKNSIDDILVVFEESTYNTIAGRYLIEKYELLFTRSGKILTENGGDPQNYVRCVCTPQDGSKEKESGYVELKYFVEHPGSNTFYIAKNKIPCARECGSKCVFSAEKSMELEGRLAGYKHRFGMKRIGQAMQERING